MTMPAKALLETAPDAGDAVAEYLRSHRRFFEDYPELLMELEIPHESGQAVSLIERQLTTLRKDNRRLKAKFAELVEIARENEHLSRRIHTLTIALMKAASVEEALALLQARLREDFRADRVALRIFADSEHGAAAEFRGRDDAARKPFAELIAEGKPVCGRPKRAQHAALLGDAASDTGSAVIMPLRGADWDGVLMIASDDPHRYSSDMGIDLLTHLCDIMSLVIGHWLSLRR